jgi:hypothetical protein
MSFLHPLAALVACNRGPGYAEELEWCEEVATPLADSSWSGPSEAEILASVAAFAPTRVRWDEWTLNVDESTLSFAPTRTADAPHVIERTSVFSPPDPACRPGPELALGVTFALDIDGGMVTGVVPGTLVSTADGSTVYVDAQGPVALDPSWEDLALDSFAERNPGDVVEEWVFGIVPQEWAPDALLDVEGVGHSVSTLWRGHWSADE